MSTHLAGCWLHKSRDLCTARSSMRDVTRADAAASHTAQKQHDMPQAQSCATRGGTRRPRARSCTTRPRCAGRTRPGDPIAMTFPSLSSTSNQNDPVQTGLATATQIQETTVLAPTCVESAVCCPAHAVSFSSARVQATLLDRAKRSLDAGLGAFASVAA
eukprot:3594938-Rhodomonas_salina.1